MDIRKELYFYAVNSTDYGSCATYKYYYTDSIVDVKLLPNDTLLLETDEMHKSSFRNEEPSNYKYLLSDLKYSGNCSTRSKFRSFNWETNAIKGYKDNHPVIYLILKDK